nr:MAG TPA: hypothetical protein [Caudoviricetes sp.]
MLSLWNTLLLPACDENCLKGIQVLKKIIELRGERETLKI